MVDTREPPNGDFVAFVEKIEREQLARAMQPHKLPHLSATGAVVTDGSDGEEPRALSTQAAQRVLQDLKRNEGRPTPSLGAMIGVFLGAGLIAFGLMAEGGIVLVLIGAALLWHGLRRLSRSRGATAGPAPTQAPAAFGNRTSGRSHGSRP